LIEFTNYEPVTRRTSPAVYIILSQVHKVHILIFLSLSVPQHNLSLLFISLHQKYGIHYLLTLCDLKNSSFRHCLTRKPCYRKDDRVMRPMYTYKLFTLILLTLTVTILCADFDSERI